MGNTCYFNAILQILVHSVDIRESCETFVIPSAEKQLSESESFHNEFSIIIRRQWNVSNRFNAFPIRPVRIFTSLSKFNSDLFRLGRQQDAHEALLGLMMATGPTERSCISKLFEFQVLSVMICHGCDRIPAPVMSLDNQVIIPLPNDDNIYSIGWGVQQRYSHEHIEGVRCQGCQENGQYATRVYAVSTHPKLLLVVANRSDAFGRKINTRVMLDQTLRFGLRSYRLIGVVHHHGNSVTSGHYTADFYHHEDKAWYTADDSIVRKKEKSLVVSRTAYIFLYELI